jgi:hypothetical protein
MIFFIPFNHFIKFRYKLLTRETVNQTNMWNYVQYPNDFFIPFNHFSHTAAQSKYFAGNNLKVWHSYPAYPLNRFTELFFPRFFVMSEM